ncbi:NAD(P)-binding domain-containing protein [Lipingzhangella sp. LS1_29]|uniref:NAD(P)-binding domain-containing protein n=1 Tax=Lipingzhangella rawalii TaxID=2055835 RepID=A0ABU2HC87_9ACTN|nr:NAD(P)-binding domain-containing protein [Lipingzhangella rawalii]MDS1272420.1 NAD(P)-binding domain-containing protein [Lipingzhangella rawalii]
MTEARPIPVTVLGLGAMGRALATALLDGGHPTTVWNRTPGRDTQLVDAGAKSAATADAAVASASLVVVCLLDHASVRAVVDPLAETLRGRTVVNLTSTTPNEARETAEWAHRHGIAYLDGGIMAVPEMIGQPEATILYSGDETAFTEHRPALDLFGSAEHLGADPGLGALYDFALLAAMYVMFAGVFHGTAMLRPAGVSATEFANRVVPWLTAMLQTVPAQAATVDSGDYSTEVQDLDFTKAALDAIVRASSEAGAELDVIAPIQSLVYRQVMAGHGAEAFQRMVETLAPAPARV